MRKEPGFAYRIFLILGDAAAIVFSFAFAYYFRTHIDPRVFYFTPGIWDFMASQALLLPIWLIILASLGLYSRYALSHRSVEYWRLFLASIIGVMAIIAVYDFFAADPIAREPLFPNRAIAAYAIVFCFIVLVITRSIIRAVRQFFLRRNVGLIRTLIVGDSNNTTQLLRGISPDSGFKVVGVVASDKYVPDEWRKRQYDNLETAFSRLHPHAVIHTGSKNIEATNKAAIDHHALYYYSQPKTQLLFRAEKLSSLLLFQLSLFAPRRLVGALKFTSASRILFLV